MPSLTVQYNSDSATVELSRDCGEEGTRHMTCRGKQDRDFILNELTCIDEAESLGISMDNTIKPISDMLSDSHKKSVELIQNIASDNNEENTIDFAVNQIDQSPEKYTDKFNVEEIMFGDQPIITDDVTTEKDAEEIKPTKVSKKLSVKEKLAKKTANIMREGKDVSVENPEEIMMGDQPALTLEEIVKEDSKGLNDNQGKGVIPKSPAKEAIVVENTSEIPITADTTAAITEAKESTTESIAKTATTTKPTTVVKPTINAKIAVASKTTGNISVVGTTVIPKTTVVSKSSTATLATTTSTEAQTTTKEEGTPLTNTAATSDITVSTTISTTQPAIKITKKSFNTVKRTSVDNDEVLLLNNKEKKHEDSALTNDHFIPPMLLVRTMFNPNNAHAEHNDTENAIINETANSVPTNILSTVVEVSPTTEKAKVDASSLPTEETVTTSVSSSSSEQPTTVASSLSTATDASTVPTLHTESSTESSTQSSTESSVSTETTSPSTTISSTAGLTEETTTIHVANNNHQQHQEGGHFRPPHAPKYSVDPQQHANQPSSTTSNTAPVSTVTIATTVSEVVTDHLINDPSSIITATNGSQFTQENDKNQKLIASISSTVRSTVVSDLSVATESVSNLATTLKPEEIVHATNPTSNSIINATQAILTDLKLDISKRLDTNPSDSSDPSDPSASAAPDAELVDHSSDLNNAENLQPYRPNRRRDLTKPESRSYLKKVFG